MNDNAKQSDQPLTRDCHCFNLRRATLAVIALYDRHMEGSGVTIQQFSILRHVSGNGALSVTELSELMGLDRTTLSRNLTLLERRGLLTTRPSSGRRRLTTLTDKGVEALERAFVRWRSAQEEMEKRRAAAENAEGHSEDAPVPEMENSSPE